MTRTHVDFPVWTWRCDRCGSNSGEFSRSQTGLPSPDEMRGRGWFIADPYGDLCSMCHLAPELSKKP